MSDAATALGVTHQVIRRSIQSQVLATEQVVPSAPYPSDLQGFGHRVRLIPPQYVKRFVKRGKNDRDDAEAMCEAASRPTMHVVPVKSAQTQADAMDPSARDLLVRQRTQLVNAVRGHAAEFGIIAAKGITQVEPLLDKIKERICRRRAGGKGNARSARPLHCATGGDWSAPDQATQIQSGQSTPRSDPGVGPITALIMAVKVTPANFSPAATSRPGWG